MYYGTSICCCCSSSSSSSSSSSLVASGRVTFKIANPTFREEQICNTQAVLGEKLSPCKVERVDFPCYLEKNADCSPNPKSAFKFAWSTHLRALGHTTAGLI